MPAAAARRRGGGREPPLRRRPARPRGRGPRGRGPQGRARPRGRGPRGRARPRGRGLGGRAPPRPAGRPRPRGGRRPSPPAARGRRRRRAAASVASVPQLGEPRDRHLHRPGPRSPPRAPRPARRALPRRRPPPAAAGRAARSGGRTRAARAVGLARGRAVEVEVERHVADRGGDRRGHRPPRRGRAGSPCAWPRHLVDRAEHALQVAEALEELGRGLLPDARHAGDVVRGVALEPSEVGHELGECIALHHAVAVVDVRLRDAAARGHHAHARLDELEGVAVAGDHHDVEVARARLAGRRWRSRRRPRSPAPSGWCSRTPRPAGRGAATARPAGRGAAGAGPCSPVVLLAPGQPAVPDHDSRSGAVLGEDLHQHRGEAEDRVRRLAARGSDGLRQREEGPVEARLFPSIRKTSRGATSGTAHPYARLSGAPLRPVSSRHPPPRRASEWEE